MASSKRSDGDGSLYYVEGRNRWVGSIVVAWKDDKPVRRTVSAKSRAKAAQRLRDLREKHERGDLPIGRAPTVAEWLDVWLDTIAAKKVRASTLAGYRSKVEQYLNPLLGRHRLDKLRPEHIEQAWQELLEVGNPSRDDPAPLTPRTVLQTHAVLRRALKVAHQRGYASRNVCTLVDPPSASDDEVTPLTLTQARKVLDTARQHRNAARWSVALSLGLRQGEALGLSWADIDLDEGTLAVRRALQRVKGHGLVLGEPKSKASRRIIAIPSGLLAELKAHRSAQLEERLHAGTAWDGGHDLVFATEDGRPIDPRQDWQTWTDLLAEAGVPHMRLHNARHTAATLLLLQGVDQRVAMNILGHSQLSMTARYQHVADEMQVAAAARMDTALWGES